MSATPAGALRPFDPAFPVTRRAGVVHAGLPGRGTGRNAVHRADCDCVHTNIGQSFAK
ncbi:hypothetical protein [Burkholderia sp. LMG 32019]|uniref:hypothetical protein n=1 Tax=Burkholderia sp. LMG 32019 TaxID=3158173 RepID=UPI003C2C64E4